MPTEHEALERLRRAAEAQGKTFAELPKLKQLVDIEQSDQGDESSDEYLVKILEINTVCHPSRDLLC